MNLCGCCAQHSSITRHCWYADCLQISTLSLSLHMPVHIGDDATGDVDHDGDVIVGGDDKEGGTDPFPFALVLGKFELTMKHVLYCSVWTNIRVYYDVYNTYERNSFCIQFSFCEIFATCSVN